MRYLFVLLFSFIFSIGFSQGNDTIKIAQVDVFIIDSSFSFQVTRLPNVISEEHVIELIFALYVLEHTQAQIAQKIHDINNSGLIAIKPGEKKPKTMKL